MPGFQFGVDMRGERLIQFGVWSLKFGVVKPRRGDRPQAGGGAKRNPCFQFGVWSLELMLEVRGEW